MVILIDVLLLDPSLDEDAPPERYHLFAETIEFVVQRLKPLELEITNEETARLPLPCCTIIHLRDKPLRITFYDYSESLLAKMSDCITADDCLYLDRKVRRDIQAYLN